LTQVHHESEGMDRGERRGRHERDYPKRCLDWKASCIERDTGREGGGETSGGEEKRCELGRKYRNFQLFLQVWAGRLAGFEGHIAVETVPFHVVGDAHDGRFGHTGMLGLRGREQEDGKGEGEGGRREGRQRMNARQRRLA